MDTRQSADGGSELSRFLRAKREQTKPESAGLSGAGRRRVPGLRRDELAMLSGISTEYYVRLEQGRDENPSAQVLEALARALRLDEEQTAHLFRLSRPLPRPTSAPAGDGSPPPSALTGLIERWPDTPAFVAGRLGDVFAANALARKLSPAYRPKANLLRVLFLDPESKGLYPDWDGETEALVAALRSAVSGSASEPVLEGLVEELSAGSGRFRELWARHDVRSSANGTTVIDHPQAGLLKLRYEMLGVLSAAGPCPRSKDQYLYVFEAEQGTVSAQRLAWLADADARALAPVRSGGASEHRVAVC